MGPSYFTKLMGPSYFTKFLFFNARRNSALERRPLILDKWVTTALRGRGVFGLAVGDSDWPSSPYRKYFDYCQELNPEDPEAVEVELFNEGRGSRQRRPLTVSSSVAPSARQ
jgi:hypothetical protein